MSTDNLLRLAVASDLHAHSNHAPSPSYLNASAPENFGNQHPIVGLLELIKRDSLRATALLCPGDLGHQADPNGIRYAWAALERAATALGADFFTATAGNHDIDSSFQGDDHDPEHILKSLTPTFPFNNEPMDDRYWARAYAIKDHDQFRLVVLNSSAYHGNTPTEKNHGRIDKRTIESLRQELLNRGRANLNLLLCHHHPHQQSEIGLGEDDVMKQGQILLDLLGSGAHGRWLVVHGHKHHPKISYAAGGGGSAVVFSAGSLCSTLYPGLQTVARNQFYVIEVDLKKLEEHGLVGKVRTWDWALGSGWIEGRDGSGLPAEFGFGTRTDPGLLAKRIAAVIKGPDSLPWNDLLASVPELTYVLPQDLERIQAELKVHHMIEITKSGSRPSEISRRI